MKIIKGAISAIVLLSISVLMYSCATIMTGTDQLVTINSNIDGASIFLDGLEIGKTPFTGEIKKNGKVLVLKKEGYKELNIALSTTIEGVFFGNIITGGTLGSLTDFASGAAYKYSPASFQVELITKEETVGEFEKTMMLRKFAMINMSNISIDLANKSGRYLQSLIHLANLEQNSNAVEIIKSKFAKSKGDQVVFGTLMVNLLEA